MKAILLAGGYATRLQPLTLDQPKPLLPVAGRPIMDYLIEKLEQTDQIEEYFVVTNAKFFDHFNRWKETLSIKKPLTIVNDMTTSNEDRLGSIGDVQYVIDTYDIHDDLCILGGDNLFEDDLLGIFASFELHGSTIAVHDVGSIDIARELGNVGLDESGKVIKFVEKPKDPFSTLCSTLIWVIQEEHLDMIADTIKFGKKDHAGDFIAYLIKDQDAYGMPLKGHWFDIGTLVQYERANDFYMIKSS